MSKLNFIHGILPEINKKSEIFIDNNTVSSSVIECDVTISNCQLEKIYDREVVLKINISRSSFEPLFQELNKIDKQSWTQNNLELSGLSYVKKWYMLVICLNFVLIII